MWLIFKKIFTWNCKVKRKYYLYFISIFSVKSGQVSNFLVNFTSKSATVLWITATQLLLWAKVSIGFGRASGWHHWWTRWDRNTEASSPSMGVRHNTNIGLCVPSRRLAIRSVSDSKAVFLSVSLIGSCYSNRSRNNPHNPHRAAITRFLSIIVKL